MSKVIFYLLSILFIPYMTIYATPALSQTNENTILIIDGSKSMWGRLKKQRKYQSVISAIKKSFNNPSIKPSFGIMTFGTRRRSCKDYQIIKPANQPVSQEHLNKLDKYKPRGRAPISLAIEQAAQELSYKDVPATIILLIDGNDNCRKNLCKMADQLQQEASNLNIHVIGLKLTKRNQKRFVCFHEQGNRTLTIVKNAEELNLALSTFLEHEPKPVAEVKKKKIDEQQITSLLTGKPRVKLHAVLTEGEPPLQKGVSWKLFQAINDRTYRSSPIAQSKEAQPLIELKPGNYIAEVRFGLIKKEQLILVPQKGALTHIIDLKAGSLKLATKNGKTGEKLNQVLYTIHRLNERSEPEQRPFARSNNSTPEFFLPEGEYKVISTFGGSRLEETVNIIAGTKTSLDLQLKLGTLELKTIAHKNGTPLDRIFYTIYKSQEGIDINNPNPELEIMQTAAPQPIIRLQEGNYIVRAENDLAKAVKQIQVKSGEKSTVIINLNASFISLKSKISGKKNNLKNDVSYQILQKSPDKDNEEITRSSKPEQNLLLTPGKYKIIGRYGTINAISEINIDLKPGQKKDITLKHKAGEIALALVDKKNGIPKLNIFWQIYDDKGNEIWRTSRPIPKFILKSGKYKVIAEYQTTTYEKSFDVKTGKTTDVKIKTK